jgi:hypothetical protein
MAGYGSRRQNPKSKEAAMSLPSMTTAFCLSGIAGLTLTSVAMLPIGAAAPDRQASCGVPVQSLACVGTTDRMAEEPGYPITLLSRIEAHPGHLSKQCGKAAADAGKRASVRLAANCAGRGPAASRLD